MEKEGEEGEEAEEEVSQLVHSHQIRGKTHTTSFYKPFSDLFRLDSFSGLGLA